ncbi:hypothetical protein ACFL1B_03750 [Nanoarchaeota archaeon]
MTNPQVKPPVKLTALILVGLGFMGLEAKSQGHLLESISHSIEATSYTMKAQTAEIEGSPSSAVYFRERVQEHKAEADRQAKIGNYMSPSLNVRRIVENFQ